MKKKNLLRTAVFSVLIVGGLVVVSATVLVGMNQSSPSQLESAVISYKYPGGTAFITKRNLARIESVSNTCTSQDSTSCTLPGKMFESNDENRDDAPPYDGKSLIQSTYTAKYSPAGVIAANGSPGQISKGTFDELTQTGTGSNLFPGPFSRGIPLNIFGTQTFLLVDGKVSTTYAVKSNGGKDLLVMNGKKDSFYKVTIALEVHPWTVVMYGGNPEVFEKKDKPVGCSNISVGGKIPYSIGYYGNCRVSLTVGSKDVVEVTPKVSGNSSYIYTLAIDTVTETH